jgi:putative PIN family toxin of toxin-antitoxin system
MRTVVDTGVLVSAAIKAQTPPSAAVHLAVVRGVLLKSRSTEAELMDVIDRPYLARLIAPTARARLVELMTKAELVSITESIATCRDPKDDKFLELAVSGGADVIVSGDADLLVLNPFRGIPIVPPATFVRDAERSPESP